MTVTVDTESIYEYHNTLTAWIDWNDDKTFGEDEVVGSEGFVFTEPPVEQTMNIVVPPRLAGVRRLRIMFEVRRNFDIDAAARASSSAGGAGFGYGLGSPRSAGSVGEEDGASEDGRSCGTFSMGEVEDYDITFERG